MIRTAAKALALLAAPLIAAVPAGAEVTESSPTHFVVRHAVDVDASPEDAWLALIAPGDWWNDAHPWSADASNMTLTPQAGGCFCEKIPAEDGPDSFGLEGSVQHMMVVQAVPHKVLRMRGGLGPLQSEPVDGVMTITLQPIEREEGEPAGTRITWEYVVGGTMRFKIEEISKAVDGVIGEQVLGLAKALGGPIDAVEEEGGDSFDSAFGAGTGEGEETPTTGIPEGR